MRKGKQSDLRRLALAQGVAGRRPAATHALFEVRGIATGADALVMAVVALKGPRITRRQCRDAYSERVRAAHRSIEQFGRVGDDFASAQRGQVCA